MTDLNLWWQTLDTLHKALWSIAIFFSLLFVVQTILTFVGGDVDVEDGDGFDSDMGSEFFTIKNFIAFFTLFAWSALAAMGNGLSAGVGLTIGVVAGILMVVLMMFLMRKAAQMRHSGTLNINNAIGLTGQAYLPIPAVRAGQGKVHVRVQGSLKELDAITDDGSTITTGSFVRITEIINGRLLLVTTNHS